MASTCVCCTSSDFTAQFATFTWRPGAPMKHFFTGLGLSTALAFATAAAQTDTWKEYVYRDDGFAISAPSEPELTSQPIYATGGTADRPLQPMPHDEAPRVMDV